ncbi:MAG: polyamine aminopropyltransferase [Myxococcales bacterium]|nr:MAG: polyamine aminopropyltransferase [Myxococcales bacterium]
MGEPRWYRELVRDAYGLTIRIDRMLVETQSPFQKIAVFENAVLGRVMTLDGAMMLTERDEPNYHEMLVHPAIFAHPQPRRVLVIGGGDGGALREIVKHPEVEEAVLCEIDPAVIEAARAHLPFTAEGFASPKARVHVGDGVEFIRAHKASFDVILVDSTDPKGFAEGLFRAPFYEDVKRALRTPGIFVQQTESPWYEDVDWPRAYAELGKIFAGVYPYGAAIPMYPTGYWTFAFASDQLDPWNQYDPGRAARLTGLKYYAPEHQRAAFALPAAAARRLKAL